MNKKRKLVKFLEDNVLDVIINSEKASATQKRQAANAKRCLNSKNYTAISVIMYYYHAIIDRKDVGDSLKKDKLPTFESVMDRFEKLIKEVMK